MNKDDKAFQFLRDNNVAVVTTADKDGNPQGASVYYVVDGNYNFYFVTSKKTKKFENIQENNSVGIVVGFGPDLETIQGGGTAKEIGDKDDQKEKVSRLAESADISDGGHWPVTELSTMEEGYALIKLELDWLSYMNLMENGEEDPYEKII